MIIFQIVHFFVFRNSLLLKGEAGEFEETEMKRNAWILLFLVLSVAASPGTAMCKQAFNAQVPFNILYAGGVEHTFIRIEHPQWDAVEFQTTASGGVQLLISLRDGNQIHYLDQEQLVQLRRKFDTSSRSRDYRYAPMKYHSKIEKDGTVEVSFSAETDMGKIEATFSSAGPLKEMNDVTDPFNHAMEVIPVLYLEKTVPGSQRTSVLLDGKPLKIRWDYLSFVQGANFGIIFRAEQRKEKLLEFKPGEKNWVGARWVYDVGGNRVTYSIEKEKDSEGFYEVKRLGNMIVQKAWVRPGEKGRQVKRVSTYSLVHDNKEFVIEFDSPLFLPTMLLENEILRSELGFKARISNSGWAVWGKIRMVSWKEDQRIRTEMEFLPSFPEFLSKRPIYYVMSEGKDRFEVIAKEMR